MQMEHYKWDIDVAEYQIKIYQRFKPGPNRKSMGSVSKSRGGGFVDIGYFYADGLAASIAAVGDAEGEFIDVVSVVISGVLKVGS